MNQLIHNHTFFISSVNLFLPLFLTFFHFFSLRRRSSECSNLKMKSPTASWILNGRSGSRNCVVPVVLAETVWFWTKVTFQRPGPAWSIRSWSSILSPGRRYNHTMLCQHYKRAIPCHLNHIYTDLRFLKISFFAGWKLIYMIYIRAQRELFLS